VSLSLFFLVSETETLSIKLSVAVNIDAYIESIIIFHWLSFVANKKLMIPYHAFVDWFLWELAN
jgi:hypothetical protein